MGKNVSLESSMAQVRKDVWGDKAGGFTTSVWQEGPAFTPYICWERRSIYGFALGVNFFLTNILSNQISAGST